MSEPPVSLSFGKDSCVHCFILDNMLAIMQLRPDKKPCDMVEAVMQAVADFLCLHEHDAEKLGLIIDGLRSILANRVQLDLNLLHEQMAAFKEASVESVHIPGPSTKQ